MPSDPRFKRDDIVVEPGPRFLLVLTHGPRAFDVIEECGGTTRYTCERPDMRLATDADFHDSAEFRKSVTDQLRAEAAAARDERRRGARIYRGHVAPH